MAHEPIDTTDRTSTESAYRRRSLPTANQHLQWHVLDGRPVTSPRVSGANRHCGGQFSKEVCQYVGPGYWTTDAVAGVELCTRLVTGVGQCSVISHSRFLLQMTLSAGSTSRPCYTERTPGFQISLSPGLLSGRSTPTDYPILSQLHRQTSPRIRDRWLNSNPQD